MKLFFLGYGITPSVGGIDRYSDAFLKHVRSVGHHVYVYTWRTPGGDSLPLPPGHVLRYRRGVDRFFLAQRLRWFLWNRGIGSIVCQHLHLAPIANNLARALGLRFDLFTFGIECWAGRFARFLPQLERLRYCTSPSAFTSRQLVEQGFPADRIVLLPPVVDLAAFSASAPRREASANAGSVLELDAARAAPFVILTVARLAAEEQYKGHDMVIRALPRVLATVPGARYRIVGKGNDQARLERLAEDLGVARSVDFLGFVPDADLPRVYAESDVFAMLSRVSLDPQKPEGEGFGIAYLEAGAMAKPLIGPNEGGSTELIRDGYNGYNVDPRSPDAIADAILQLATDRLRCLAMGENARASVAARFTTAQLPGYAAALLR